MDSPKPNHLAWALAILVAAMLVACLWPFNFRPSNQVEWRKREPGIRFTGMGQIVSRDPFPPLAQLSGDGSISVEINVRPARITGNSLPNILTFHREGGPSPLMIGAWKNSLIVRLESPTPLGGKPYRELGVHEAFAIEKTIWFTLTSGPRGTHLYLDGRLQREAPGISIPNNPLPLGKLLLGMSPAGRSEWNGDILGLRIYRKTLTGEEVLQNFMSSDESAGTPPAQTALIAAYRFTEGSGRVIHDVAGTGYDLLIPNNYRPLSRSILTSPAEDFHRSKWFFLDAFLNIAGFIPFAYLAMLVLGQSLRLSDVVACAVVLLAGVSFSLSIELIQIYLPTRSSSSTDLAMNTVGTAAGVILFFILREIGANPPFRWLRHPIYRGISPARNPRDQSSSDRTA